MFYDLYPQKRREYFARKLIEEKGYVELGDIAGAADDIDTIDRNSITPKKYREHALSYLFILLKEKKVKIGGFKPLSIDQVESRSKIYMETKAKEGSPAAIKKILSQKRTPWREFTGTPEETIEIIRKEWEEAEEYCKKNNEPTIGYEMSIWIALPETPWQYYDKDGGPFNWSDYNSKNNLS